MPILLLHLCKSHFLYGDDTELSKAVEMMFEIYAESMKYTNKHTRQLGKSVDAKEKIEHSGV